jgi:hypothetical protein
MLTVAAPREKSQHEEQDQNDNQDQRDDGDSASVQPKLLTHEAVRWRTASKTREPTTSVPFDGSRKPADAPSERTGARLRRA